MADYITKVEGKEILGQAYSHLDIDFFKDDNQRENLERLIKSYVEPRAKFLFGNDIDVVVDFEEGSLKSTITVWGIVGSIITGVAQYKPIKEGVIEIDKDIRAIASEIWNDDAKAAEAKKNLKESAEDASRLAQATNLEVLFNTGARSCQKIRLEKRTGVIGRAAHLIKVLDGIKNDYKIIDGKADIRQSFLVASLYYRMASLKNEFSQNINKIESDDGQFCLAAIIYRDLISFNENQPALIKLRYEIEGYKGLSDFNEDQKEIIATHENLSNLLKEIKSFKKLLEEYFPKQTENVVA